MKKVNEHTCPKCGFTPKFIENVEVEEGELVAIKGNKHSKDDKQRVYSELLGFQRERALSGKTISDGWVANQYKNMVGCWPRGLNNSAIQPSEQTRGFIKHQMIKFAKRKR